jgi:alkanesulfonate monooxygenase SsuD/methylene tetrahydromethanopterin reductase-like flavin-dependent oxidoreductase (luciferase family)
MRFGLFGSAQARRGGPDVDSGVGFREFVDYNVEAEALGFHSTFLVEHHFTGFGQISATLNLLTFIAARTTTLRLGTAVIVLPWHNPVLLAEQAATLDLLSRGRLDFGVGMGYRYREFAGFCLPMEEAAERFDESLAVILRAWTSDAPWSHRGKYWQFDDVVVEPPPAQKPHPPLWMGAGSAESIRKVAARDYRLLLDQYASIDEIGERIALFRSEVERHGRAFDPMSVAVTRSINVVRTPAELQTALEARIAARRRIDRLTFRPDATNARRVISDEAICAGALYGTPAEITVKLQALRAAGAEYVLLNSAGGPASLRRFAHEVRPAFVDVAALQPA